MAWLLKLIGDARVFAGFDSFMAVVIGQLMMERTAAQRTQVLKKQSVEKKTESGKEQVDISTGR